MAAEVVIADDVSVVGVGPAAGSVEGVSESGAFEDAWASGIENESVAGVCGDDWCMVVLGVAFVRLAGRDGIEVVIGVESDGEEELA